jgi:kynureninase
MTKSNFEFSLDEAAALDAADQLAGFREAFAIPAHGGRDSHYLCGHSLGLMPRAVSSVLARELEQWSRRGVAGHFADDRGWYAYHEQFAAPLARLLGVDSSEVVAMNSLTVNLHLMLVSFFEPGAERCRIAIERGAFPSDRFAVQSQLRYHGLDPELDLVEISPPESGASETDLLDPELLDAVLAAERGRVALVLLPGVQYLTGQAIDLAGCAAVARRYGCRVGIDLAHAVGNLDLDLRAAEPDFAVWCSYKYLNAGPGAIGGCFVNRRWHGESLPRFEGWWGHDKLSRFAPERGFVPIAGAEAWQLSNPPILAMAPLAASLDLFDAAGMARLRHKSQALTAFLARALEQTCGDRIEHLTPDQPEARGAQLSLKLNRTSAETRRVVEQLEREGIVADRRAPDILRLAPVPLYNRFADAAAAAAALGRAIAA